MVLLCTAPSSENEIETPAVVRVFLRIFSESAGGFLSACYGVNVNVVRTKIFIVANAKCNSNNASLQRQAKTSNTLQAPANKEPSKIPKDPKQENLNLQICLAFRPRKDFESKELSLSPCFTFLVSGRHL